MKRLTSDEMPSKAASLIPTFAVHRLPTGSKLFGAIHQARASAVSKEVWLVYQINDDESTIDTIVSSTNASGELYRTFQIFQESKIDRAINQEITDIEDQFDTQEGLLELNADAAIKSLKESGAALEKESGKILRKLDQDKFKLKKQLKTRIIASRETAKVPIREAGRGANKIKDEILTHVTDADLPENEPRHAEENFILRWSSIKGKREDIKVVSLYLNFSPCISSSTAKIIDKVQYSEGCLYKLKQLANQYKSIQWNIYYDAVFHRPRPEDCRIACVAANKECINLKLFRLNL